MSMMPILEPHEAPAQTAQDYATLRRQDTIDNGEIGRKLMIRANLLFLCNIVAGDAQRSTRSQ